jgi:hypothetical protein
MTFLQEAKRELNTQLAKESRLQVQKQLRVSFEKVKREMIKEFKDHPVTKEIKAGIDSDNISNTLGGATNLFSFIGFNDGSDPIEPILDLLETTKIRFVAIKNPMGLDFSVDLPSAKEIFQVTPMPFMSGRSWAQGIETGISGLIYYLKAERPSSRSGLGIQSPRKVRKKGVKFKNTKYISDIIKRYKIKFESQLII